MKLKEPWEEAPHIWPTKSAFFTYLRGALRKAVWERWPLKHEFKNEKCEKPPPDYKGRAKSGNYCALSGEWVGKSAAEIDHIEGNVSLNDWSDVLPFVRHLCASKDNMQYVTKEAHKIKSYAERHGMTYDQASVEKRIIKILNQNNSEDLKKMLDTHNLPSNNDLVRRDSIRKLIERGLI